MFITKKGLKIGSKLSLVIDYRSLWGAKLRLKGRTFPEAMVQFPVNSLLISV